MGNWLNSLFGKESQPKRDFILQIGDLAFCVQDTETIFKNLNTNEPFGEKLIWFWFELAVRKSDSFSFVAPVLLKNGPPEAILQVTFLPILLPNHW